MVASDGATQERGSDTTVIPVWKRLRLGRTVLLVAASLVMVRLSIWQWQRYEYKVALLASYEENATAPAVDLLAREISVGSDSPFEELLHKKVRVAGHFDFERQVIITNRKDSFGPGHILFTPLRLKGRSDALWVNRGFLPFKDRDSQSWAKYDEPGEVEFDAVLQRSRQPWNLGPENPEPTAGGSRIWYFEEIPRLAKLLPYPVMTGVFVEKLYSAERKQHTNPPVYPSEAVTVQVPPSTHFGYMIEWALLAEIGRAHV